MDSIKKTLFQSQIHPKDEFFILKRDSLLQPPPQTSPAPPSSGGKISPAVLFIIVILAVIFFISSLLHLLVRFLIRKHPSSNQSGASDAAAAGSADALQRQLQQLFHLHDAGLDQAFIDALPVFLYREIVGGTKEPFDCAVCLCEFTGEDNLRLLPVCGHAFHINCIDTWLLSNSTCPLCRGSLFIPGLTIENPIFDFNGNSPEEGPSGDREDGEEIVAEKRVFPVKLGKFRNLSNQVDAVDGDEAAGRAIGNVRRDGEESSSSNLDARRCYSMGSYQYVVADASLQVKLPSGPRRSGDSKGVCGNAIADEEGKRLGIGSKGESFSVSKIWMWPDKKGKGKFPISSDASSLDGGLPWMKERRSIGDI